MAKAFFEISLTVKPEAGGGATLVLPKALQGLNCRFVLVKEGGEEGIVHLEAPEETVKKVEKDRACKKLTAKQAEALGKEYPAPKLKNRYRPAPPAPDTAMAAGAAGAFETDAKGKPVVEVVQTVRSGFYLIDIPLHPGTG